MNCRTRCAGRRYERHVYPYRERGQPLRGLRNRRLPRDKALTGLAIVDAGGGDTRPGTVVLQLPFRVPVRQSQAPLARLARAEPSYVLIGADTHRYYRWEYNRSVQFATTVITARIRKTRAPHRAERESSRDLGGRFYPSTYRTCERE
jgi:hypothetical protein